MEQESGIAEPAIVKKTLEVKAVTNFQIFQENGGFNLVLGSRNLITGEGHFPIQETEVFACCFLSHAMLKDMARIFGVIIQDFEKLYGAVPVPGVDQPRDQSTNNES